MNDTLRVQRDVSLQPHNTFGLPARAAWYARIEAAAQVPALLADASLGALPRLVLGGGSNVLFTRDFDGLVLHVAIPGIEVLAEAGDELTVAVGAGENWHGFVATALARGWYGLENLALIPGTVGASPIQNIGAYGVEMRERCEWVEVLDFASGGQRRLAAADCGFAYRDSCFKRDLAGRVLVTRVAFRLSRTPRVDARYADIRDELAARGIAAPTPRDVFDAVCAVRRRKLPDPATLGNAGSFFKNPLVTAATAAALRARFPELVAYPQPDGTVKIAAGWLIDRCGWKGRSLGRAGVYERQALVLVNRGGADGAEVLALARAIQADVRARFGIELEPEPVAV
ncbi:UDP-N-acetylmuramate dehydrogenase [Plasticicumulans lactativorans]|uniref:UDP-N-acetylenolpyruvoylglucosamine reductase n=1 Tax=Plasticicumulans lactativorans TaxID=1133106 RepID=A0A4R2L7Q4_9GAMM|nr:UDP-N-acetylmuramate dehydrogenase [Plasticicumulans lactativorans]TCO82676.1 UDP-N-acetylmuramate dehydrogenase [Plasticicumulans lactativorans]